MSNEHPEFHVVKRFVALGPVRDHINIPFFPVGFATLWEYERDEIKTGKLLREIDLLSIQADNNSSVELSEYKTLFQLISHTKILHKPIPSFNFQLWKKWQRNLENMKVWILEAKSAKGDLVQALGQILMYKELFRTDYPSTEIARCGIISEGPIEADLLTKHVCNSLGIDIFRI